MMVSWARLTTPLRTGTTSILLEVVIGARSNTQTVREVHQTFLKGTTETIENMDIRFADQNVAVGTVTSIGSPFTSPDGVKHSAGRSIRTFVVVNRGGRWLIMQDHNTMVIDLPAR